MYIALEQEERERVTFLNELLGRHPDLSGIRTHSELLHRVGERALQGLEQAVNNFKQKYIDPGDKNPYLTPSMLRDFFKYPLLFDISDQMQADEIIPHYFRENLKNTCDMISLTIASEYKNFICKKAQESRSLP